MGYRPLEDIGCDDNMHIVCQNRGRGNSVIRVLMITTRFYPVVGGAEKQAQKLAKKLVEKGLDVKVVTGWWDRKTPRKEMVDGIPVFRNFTFWGMFGIRGIRKFGTYTYMVTLLLYLLRHRKEYDVIHVHSATFPAFVGVIAGKLLSKPTIVKVMTSGKLGDIKRMQENRIMSGTRQMLPVIRNADCVISLNSQAGRELVEAGFRKDGIAYIPNGVEIDDAKIKASYDLNHQVTLTFVGRLHPKKGLDILLRAFNKAVQRKPGISWQLLILGDGSLRSELEATARQLGIWDETRFCGYVDDVFPYLARTDIFVLPSYSEGVSNALLEAMSCGSPCIATDIAGNADVITDGENGLLVRCGEENDLATAIIRLVEKKELRARLGNEALETVKRSYSIESVTDRYVDLYRQLLQSKSSEVSL